VTAEVRSYVALGDSFTCGRSDSEPRWADVVAAELGPAVRYLNLAEVGATSADVESHQLPAALALRPDLVSLVCGANDVLLSVRPDPDGYARRLARMIDGLRPAAVFTGTYPSFSRYLDLRPRTRARVDEGMRLVNEAIRAVARERDVLLIEGVQAPSSVGRESFAEDGFHPSPEGHRRTADAVVRALREWLPAQERATA
jgi:lysophospholipase L1-like esterase